MRKRDLIIAISVILLLAALSLWMQNRAAEIEQMGVEEEPFSVDANWREIINVEIPCDPAEWRNVIVYELRDGDQVIDQQEVDTHCRVVCEATAGYEGVCGEIVNPVWNVVSGTYEVWFKGLWINESRGLEIVSHPVSVDVDERGFRPMGVYSLTPKVSTIFLPRAVKAYNE